MLQKRKLDWRTLLVPPVHRRNCKDESVKAYSFAIYDIIDRPQVLHITAWQPSDVNWNLVLKFIETIIWPFTGINRLEWWFTNLISLSLLKIPHNYTVSRDCLAKKYGFFKPSPPHVSFVHHSLVSDSWAFCLPSGITVKGFKLSGKKSRGFVFQTNVSISLPARITPNGKKCLQNLMRQVVSGTFDFCLFKLIWQVIWTLGENFNLLRKGPRGDRYWIECSGLRFTVRLAFRDCCIIKDESRLIKEHSGLVIHYGAVEVAVLI